VTGELSHHEVLAARERGQHVILCGHTNTERGYLKFLQGILQRGLDEEVGEAEVQVIVSQKDRDPLEFM
jgi:putative NIF3 family GTP cyclohydrolase 1 type 2